MQFIKPMRDPADKAFVSHINNIPMFFSLCWFA